MTSKLVAFIIGAGSNVGDSVAQTLLKQNYKVALGSRNPKRDNVPEGLYPFSIDVTKPESINPAFDKVIADIGPPNIVIFNGVYFFPRIVNQMTDLLLLAATFERSNLEDPLSLPFSGFSRDHAVTASFYLAAQEALSSFRSPIHKDSVKAFIVTGNLLAFIPAAASEATRFGLGLQKRSEAYLTELFHNVYAKEGIRYVFSH